MLINDPKNFNIPDNFPGVSLENIPIHSNRAQSLYSRNKKLVKDGHLQIMGAIHMLKGLEYHFNNFKKISETCPHVDSSSNIKWPTDKTKQDNIRNLSHEAIAYLNRLGQFHKFYEGTFCKGKLSGIKKSKINQIIKLRHKYSAHREIDKNQNVEEKYYAMELLFSSGSLWNNKNRIFQFQDENGKIINFDLLCDHDEIITEVYNIIETSIMKK